MSTAIESCETGYRVRGNARNNGVVKQTLVCGENGLWNITGCERKGKVCPLNTHNVNILLTNKLILEFVKGEH